MSDLRILALAALVLGAGALFYVATYSGYDSRRFVGEAIKEAEPLKARIVEYHHRTRALPQGAEAKALRLDSSGLKRARSVEWDATRAMLVVTMEGKPYPGKRFGWMAEARDGSLEWTCRPIDMESKYLPAACR